MKVEKDSKLPPAHRGDDLESRSFFSVVFLRSACISDVDRSNLFFTVQEVSFSEGRIWDRRAYQHINERMLGICNEYALSTTAAAEYGQGAVYGVLCRTSNRYCSAKAGASRKTRNLCLGSRGCSSVPGPPQRCTPKAMWRLSLVHALSVSYREGAAGGRIPSAVENYNQCARWAGR